MPQTDSHVLLLGERTDPHVSAVSWWLQLCSIPFAVVSTREFPATALASIALSGTSPAPASINFAGEALSLGGPSCKGVWNRRRPFPEPRPGTHPADLQAVRQQSTLFLTNLLCNSAPEALWVNSLEAQRLADQKITGLRAARQCGFTVPDTLASNDPSAIRAFAEAHGWNIIGKNFIQGGWQTAEGRFVMMRTSALDREHLQDDESIAKCPLIYQPLIRKSGELRITVIGDRVFAFAVLTADPNTVDWRTDETAGSLRFEPREIPPSLERACVSLCSSLGIVFGCIDILVLRDGSYVFLEVNESGQFLWLEEACPDVPLLDSFCRVLTSRTNRHLPRNPIPLHKYHCTPEWTSLLSDLRMGRVKQGGDGIVPDR